MKKQQVKKLISAVIVSTWVGVVVLFVGHGCSEVGQVKKTSGPAASLGEAGSEGIQIFPNTKTVSTVYAKQFLDNMVSCTGLGIESATTRGAWESRQGSLSEFGYATDVTPPMMMAVASVAGEVCSDIIDKESTSGAERVIFAGFNLSGSTNVSEKQQAIQRLALSCWHRRASTNEVQTIQDMVDRNTASVSDNGRTSALLLCTAMLASYSSIEM